MNCLGVEREITPISSFIANQICYDKFLCKSPTPSIIKIYGDKGER